MADLTIIQTDEGSYALDRKSKVSARTIRYEVYGAGSKEEMMQKVWDQAPRLVDNDSMIFDGVDCNEIGESYAVITAKYKIKERGESWEDSDSGSSSTSSSEPPITDVGYAIDCTMTTAHIEQCNNNDQRKDHESPDPGFLIGWNFKTETGRDVKGVDIQVPVVRETYTRDISIATITDTYINQIAKVTGKINRGSFKGWEAGEVLFLGPECNGEVKDKKLVMKFHFLIKTNEPNFKYMGETVNKPGHAYLWSFPEYEKDTGNLKKVHVYASDIYPSADFSVLGL